jgi:hypothetical protein
MIVFGRFLIAIGSNGISVNAYVICKSFLQNLHFFQILSFFAYLDFETQGMETIKESKKKYCALVFEFSFAIGQIFLILSAYFMRDWRMLAYIVIVPCIPFLLYIW